jgi:hypothetical protein
VLPGLLNSCSSCTLWPLIVRVSPSLFIAQVSEWRMRTPWDWKQSSQIPHEGCSRTGTEMKTVTSLVDHIQAGALKAALRAMGRQVLSQMDGFMLSSHSLLSHIPKCQPSITFSLNHVNPDHICP